jgi:hypothetical protein
MLTTINLDDEHFMVHNWYFCATKVEDRMIKVYLITHRDLLIAIAFSILIPISVMLILAVAGNIPGNCLIAVAGGESLCAP